MKSIFNTIDYFIRFFVFLCAIILLTIPVYAQTILKGSKPTTKLALIGSAPSTFPLQLTVHYAIQHQADLDSLIQQQQNRKSPLFHRWLKTGEFEQRFGLTDIQKKTIADWLTTSGFTVKKQTGRYIEVIGQAQQAKKAFGVTIGYYGDLKHYGPDSNLKIPASISSIVGPITGLDNLNEPKPTMLINGVYGSQYGIGPWDFYSLYHEFPDSQASSFNGAGTCVGVISGSEIPDIAMNLFSSATFIPNVLVKRYLDGTDEYTGTEFEALIDTQWSHAGAPGAGITMYYGGVTSINQLTQDAVTDNTCAVISLSRAICGESGSLFTAMHPIYEQGVTQGQTFTVSTGDAGSPCDGVTGSTNPNNGLATDPNVTAVGGTSYAYGAVSSALMNPLNFVVPDHFIEQVIQSVQVTSEGGASIVYTKPSWQTGTGVPADGARDYPDVSAEAESVFFIAADLGAGGPVTMDNEGGGTSVAAPEWAGIIATLNQYVGERLGNINPALYYAANQGTGFYDVTIGNNHNPHGGTPFYYAGIGYDLATGLGTPRFDQLAPAVKSYILGH